METNICDKPKSGKLNQVHIKFTKLNILKKKISSFIYIVAEAENKKEKRDLRST
jgi:hypothetical protein